MSVPKASVCIASYNHSKYLPNAIESVLAQTYKDIEIIIVDDGSTDGSLDIINSYAAKYQNIKAFTHPGHKNKGTAATVNLGIESSRGEYISLLDSDDALYPCAIEEQVNCLNVKTQTGIAYGISRHIDEDGELLETTSGHDIWSEPDWVERLILNNKIAGATVMVRRMCFDEVGLFSSNLVNLDHEMWLRIVLFSKWKVSFINKPLGLYRKHNTNVSLNQSRTTYIYRSIQVLRELLHKFDKKKRTSNEFNLLKKELERKEQKLVLLELKEGKILSAVKVLSLYVLDNPKKIFYPKNFIANICKMLSRFWTVTFSKTAHFESENHNKS